MAHLHESSLLFGETAWHKLGTVLPADSPERFSVSDSIRISGLDWTVAKVPLTISPLASHCADQPLDGCYGIVRIGKGNPHVMEGVSVGEKYHCLQNAEMFDWFQPFLDSKRISFETLGSLDGGKKVWILANILDENGESTIDIGGGDTIQKRLLLSGSHDGSAATSVGFSPIRVVCWNTLSAALSAGGFLKVRHTRSQKDTLAIVRDTIDLAEQSFRATTAQYQQLLYAGISATDLRNYVKIVFDVDKIDDGDMSTRMRNIVDRCCHLAKYGKGNEGELTLWSAYNGVTEYLTHEKNQGNPNNQLKSLWFGSSAKTNLRAFEVAMSLSA